MVQKIWYIIECLRHRKYGWLVGFQYPLELGKCTILLNGLVSPISTLDCGQDRNSVLFEWKEHIGRGRNGSYQQEVLQCVASGLAAPRGLELLGSDLFSFFGSAFIGSIPRKTSSLWYLPEASSWSTSQLWMSFSFSLTLWRTSQVEVRAVCFSQGAGRVLIPIARESNSWWQKHLVPMPPGPFSTVFSTFHRWRVLGSKSRVTPGFWLPTQALNLIYFMDYA